MASLMSDGSSICESNKLVRDVTAFRMLPKVGTLPPFFLREEPIFLSPCVSSSKSKGVSQVKRVGLLNLDSDPDPKVNPSVH